MDADADRLCQIFTRLIMVGGRYARDGDAVVVTAKGDGDCAVLSVTTGAIGSQEDDGPFAPDPAGLQVDFPPARASLDLTLATRLAEAHGGETIINKAAPGALSAYCRMPRLPDAA